jgi:hypothetical protein
VERAAHAAAEWVLARGQLRAGALERPGLLEGTDTRFLSEVVPEDHLRVQPAVCARDF